MPEVRHFILGLRTGILKVFHSRSCSDLSSGDHVLQTSYHAVHTTFPSIHTRLSNLKRLDLQTLDFVLESPDLAHEVGRLVRGNRSGNDSASDTAGAAKSHLGGDVDVGHVLVLAEKRQVQEDSERRGVGGQDDELADTAVQRLGGFVGALLKLPVVRGLLDKIPIKESQRLYGSFLHVE